MELHRGGAVSKIKVTDVRYIKYCPENDADTRYVVSFQNMTMYAREVEFREVSWIEKVEDRCIRYERPPIEAAATIALELSKHLKAISELLSKFEVHQTVAYYEQHKGCSEAYTWVTNKVGAKYWYWYLKCPHKTPSSIYIGKNPEGHRKRMKLARALSEAYYRLRKVGLRELAEELEEAAMELQLLGVEEGEREEVPLGNRPHFKLHHG